MSPLSLDVLRVRYPLVLANRDGLVNERDALVAERDNLLKERNALVAERDTKAQRGRIGGRLRASVDPLFEALYNLVLYTLGLIHTILLHEYDYAKEVLTSMPANSPGWQYLALGLGTSAYSTVKVWIMVRYALPSILSLFELYLKGACASSG